MKRGLYIIVLIFIIFFSISLITNILGPIIPEVITSFDLSLLLAAFLPFSFFAAYGVMSIPAGMLVDKLEEKPVMLAAFFTAFAGSLLFALYPGYSIALISLFMIGTGMAMLQVAINPLLRTAGGEKHFAFNSVFAQLIFGSASFLSPWLYSYLVSGIKTNSNKDIIISTLSNLVPQKLPWVSLYWLFACVTFIMLLLILISRFPKVERKEDELSGTWKIYRELFRNRVVISYFVGIFAYVGTEQGVANWISQFLLTYHNVDPLIGGAKTVSLFWGLMTAGCVLGLILLKLFDSRKILIWFASAAVLFLTLAFTSTKELAMISFPAVGFFASVMWSIIFSLALNSLEKNHGSFSGILCTAIIGGAIVPLIIGWLGDLFGLRQGMFFLYLTLGYIFSIGFWAKPLINNQTINFKKKEAVETV